MIQEKNRNLQKTINELENTDKDYGDEQTNECKNIKKTRCKRDTKRKEFKQGLV